MTHMLRNWSLSLCALTLTALPAHPQTTLTGAMLFATTSNGANTNQAEWNTLGGDSIWDLWLALSPDASAPVNGPSDARAGISIPLSAGGTYRYYIFTQSNAASFGSSGMNLFFDGNGATPGISVTGALNGIKFQPNSSDTLTLQGNSVPGSGTNFYSSGGAIVLLTAYNFNQPNTLDVCQSKQFAPGNGPDYFGSFTLQVFPAATLTSSLPSAFPGTRITLAGSGFGASEPVTIYFGSFNFLPFATATADASGAFTVAARVPQEPYGPKDLYAVGQTSGKVGATSISLTADLAVSPRIGAHGSAATAQGFGFGAGETVQIYWAFPRQLLGTTTTNSSGSFFGGNALHFAIPTNAPPGSNTVTAIGQTTQAVAIARVTVK